MKRAFNLLDKSTGEIIRVEACKRGKEYNCKCPFHPDKHPSLWINETKGCYHCFGCNVKGIIADNQHGTHATKLERFVTEYIYENESRVPVFKITRHENKKFVAWRPDGNGGWTKGLKGIKRVPYHLPELLASAGTVFIVEGEKDCQTMAERGFVATTNPFGAKAKWQSEFSDFLKKRDCVLIPDNDKPGKDHMTAIAESLLGKAASVKIVELPGLSEGEDVTDWFSHRHTADELNKLVQQAKEYEHAEIITNKQTPIPGGYYLKARKIQESEAAHASPCVREVWDWLLMTANHKMVRRNGTTIKRGETVKTYNDIQNGLSWKRGFIKKAYSKSDIENALRYLRTTSMITTRKTTRGIFITIVNYDFYQNPKNYENHTNTATINKNGKNSI